MPSNASAETPPMPGPSVVMTQMLGGFQISQALYVMAKLNVCTLLDEGPLSVDELAARTGARPEPLRRLVRTLASLGVFRTSGDSGSIVETTALGATLSRRHPESMANTAEFLMETHYGPFGELLHTARTGEPGADRHFGLPFLDWITADNERAALMTRAMADVTAGLPTSMFDGYELPPGRVLADIGGADGSVLAMLLKDRPERHGIVLDMPAVIPHAHREMDRRGLADRVRTVAGDFFASVPEADIYLLGFILHDWDDDAAVRILHSIRRAAAPGARLLVIEGIIPPGDAPHLMKFIDLTMLGMLSGRERTAAEFATVLDAGGFDLDRIVPTPSPFSVIEATAR